MRISKPLKAFVIECGSLEWIETVRELYETNIVQPVLWTGPEKTLGALGDEWGTEFKVIDTYDAMCGNFPSEQDACNGYDEGFSMVQRLQGDLHMIMKMMDRMEDTGARFSYSERYNLFYRLTVYWTAKLEFYQPEVVMFPHIPHMVYDFIIYRVACQKNIKTMMFHFSSFPHRLIYCERIFSETELQKQYRALLRNQDMDAYSLDTRTKEFLDAKRGTDYEKAMPDILKRNYSEIERSHSTRSYLFYLATNLGINIVVRRYGTYIYNLLIKNISQKQRIKDKSNYVKRPDVAISASTKVTEVAKARQGFRNRLQKNKMRTIYSSLTNEVDLSQNFVYFPLHYQPELTTVPLGGHFTEQDQVIELVAGCLPAGWSIYVKEYVWQFAPRSQGERARSVEFYQRISRIPRVVLVKTDTPTFELIDRSKAVVTITGTAGWEGVARGKPCFLFGNAWYSGCEGTFSVQSQKDCERVFELIQKGYSVNQEKVTLFCRALDMVGVEAYANEKDGTGSGISPEQNINNLVEFFRQELAS